MGSIPKILRPFTPGLLWLTVTAVAPSWLAAGLGLGSINAFDELGWHHLLLWSRHRHKAWSGGTDNINQITADAKVRNDFMGSSS
jgi:hypothetical protein